jgi:phosphoglycolate phosphatase
MMKHFNLTNLFDHAFGINDKYAASKLNRGEELIGISKVPKNQTILIGDTLHDLEVGQHLGIDVLLVSHGHQSVDRLRSKHDAVLTI